MPLLKLFFISLASFCTVYLSSALCRKFNVLDTPNDRSSHVIPTPRLGGLGFILIFSIFLTFSFPFATLMQYKLLILGFFLLIFFSTIYDLRGLSPSKRFLIHIIFGVAVYSSGFQLSTLELPFLTLHFTGALACFLTIFYCVSWVNIYNFMDGMNGYAGSMGIIGCGSLLLLFSIPLSSAPGVILLTLIGVLIGFLILNIYKPKTFMGDGGSAFLGGFVAVITLYLPTFISFLCFAPFFADAAVTLTKRLLRKERFWEAHREHFYQLLMRSGWHQLSILSLEVAHMLINLGLLVVYIGHSSLQLIVASIFVVLFFGKFLGVQRVFSHFDSAQ